MTTQSAIKNGDALSLAYAPLALAQALIRCPSVTPAEGGGLGLLEYKLGGLGFRCERMKFGLIDNLYARIGTQAPHFCFAGHTDVVPPGDESAWRHPPFSAGIENGELYGRGAADMKGAVAAFISAVATFLADRQGALPGSISLLITGDEEGDGIDGTKRVLETLASRRETIDACLVGEPTCAARLGDTAKIGRRGSLTARIKIIGSAGHAAYPERADNPLPRMVNLLQAIGAEPLDKGTEAFDPSTLTITSIDTGNTASNVIPAQANAVLNIRFNTCHSGESLSRWLADMCARHSGAHEMQIAISGEPFLTAPGRLVEAVAQAVQTVTGLMPALTTGGGTSDARFIHSHAPVIEFGLVGATMHKTDERISIDDLNGLTNIYREILRIYFSESNCA